MVQKTGVQKHSSQLPESPTLAQRCHTTNTYDTHRHQTSVRPKEPSELYKAQSQCKNAWQVLGTNQLSVLGGSSTRMGDALVSPLQVAKNKAVSQWRKTNNIVSWQAVCYTRPHQGHQISDQCEEHNTKYKGIRPFVLRRSQERERDIVLCFI